MCDTANPHATHPDQGREIGAGVGTGLQTFGGPFDGKSGWEGVQGELGKTGHRRTTCHVREVSIFPMDRGVDRLVWE